MFQTAKFMKDRCAAARRTATSLEQLSKDISLDIADKGLLLKASQVLSGMANRMSAEAKRLKAKEIAFEKAYSAALKEAEAAVAAWPSATTLDQLAKIDLAGNISYFRQAIEGRASGDIARSLLHYQERASDEIARSIAWRAASKGTVAEIAQQEREKRDVIANTRLTLLALARTIDDRINAPQQVAA